MIVILQNTALFAQSQLIQSFAEENIIGDTRFGISVSNAGDVNNDGFDDIIIGANVFEDHTGRAYIFLEALRLTTKPMLFLQGRWPVVILAFQCLLPAM